MSPLPPGVCVCRTRTHTPPARPSRYKTAFYSFFLPVALGMTLAGVEDVRAYNAAREILVVMGVYFQVCLCRRRRPRAHQEETHCATKTTAMLRLKRGIRAIVTNRRT